MAGESAAVVAAVAAAFAAAGSLVVAVLAYRAEGPRVRVYLRWPRDLDGEPVEGDTLVLEVSNEGRSAATVIGVGLAVRRGWALRRGRPRRHQVNYRASEVAGGPPAEAGTVVRHRLEGGDAVAWRLPVDQFRLGPRRIPTPSVVRGFAHLGNADLVTSTQRYRVRLRDWGAAGQRPAT